MQFDRDRFHLVYFEVFLEEYWETVDFGEYDRDILRHEWKRFIRVESFENLKEAIEKAADLLQLVDYDHDIEFIGIFEGDKMIYGRKWVTELANDYLSSYLEAEA